MSKVLSIIVLNWNEKEMTEECLNSLINQVDDNSEIIVVDNGSTDGSVNYLRKKFEKIIIIESKNNLGYSGGNNLGVEKSKGEYILILNNDLILDENSIKEIIKNKDNADILGFKNYYYDQKNIIWAIGSKVNKLLMKASLVFKGIEDKGQLDNEEVEQIVGSAMLINRKVIDKIGFLDEKYFCYYEETEWQTRAIDKGFTISWIPSAKLWHKVAFSTGGGRTPLSAYYLVRNRAYFIKEHSKHKLIAYIYWLLEIAMRISYGLLKDRKYSKMAFLGMIDFMKGVKGKRWNKK